jgi:hypothetical protein
VKRKFGVNPEMTKLLGDIEKEIELLKDKKREMSQNYSRTFVRTAQLLFSILRKVEGGDCKEEDYTNLCRVSFKWKLF